jgi:nicotinate dehydrogenase subunit B
MNSPDPGEMQVEFERDELFEAPRYHFDVDRRAFFKVLGGGIVILLFADAALAQESGQSGRRRGGGQRPAELGAWLHIAEDGTVSVFTGKAEVGQNIRTSLSQVVAEELRVPVASIRVVMGDTAKTPYDAGTFGSRTTPDMAVQLRRAGATAREALLDLAAESFQTERANLAVADGKVSRVDTKEARTFGELTKGKQLMKSVTEQAPITPVAGWKVAGTSVPKVDGREFVTGRHRYSTDIKRPGMLHGKVLRPSAFEATPTTIDTSAAEAMSNVTVVRDGAFVGVTAPDSQLAERAIESIKAEWATKLQSSNAQLFEELKKNVSAGGGDRGGRGGGGNKGSMDEGLASADHKLEQTYTIAYIAHVPLEPRAAVAEWEEGKLTVWTGTQRPFGVRGDLAQAFGIPQDSVRVIVPDTGSGYGGKHSGEAAVEAARLAKGAGKPVKLVWTREEEFTWAYFRPAGVIDIISGVRNDGTLTAWEFHNYNSGGSAIRTPYDVPNQKIEFHSSRSPLRQGSYRALASTANVFARESHMDELAHSIKMDPLEFRLKNLKDERMRAVLEKAAEAFGWSKVKAQAAHGFGIACGTEKGSYVATCAEVATDRETHEVKVLRAVSAFECGAVLNPDHLKSQVEGAMVQGIGGALFEAVEFENGRIKNPHLSSYRVPRFSDTPAIEVVLVNRPDLPSAGAGETPIVGIAPAIGNAIFAATGLRRRSLPMVPNGLKA